MFQTRPNLEQSPRLKTELLIMQEKFTQILFMKNTLFNIILLCLGPLSNRLLVFEHSSEIHSLYTTNHGSSNIHLVYKLGFKANWIYIIIPYNLEVKVD